MKNHLKESIIERLKTCFDPEIPLDLWSLGLIYDVEIEEKNKKNQVKITMSLTTPGCSMGQHMADDIKTKVSDIDQVSSVDVSVTFDPPWNPSMMTSEARKKLGFDSVQESKKEQTNKVEWE